MNLEFSKSQDICYRRGFSTISGAVIHEEARVRCGIGDLGGEYDVLRGEGGAGHQRVEIGAAAGHLGVEGGRLPQGCRGRGRAPGWRQTRGREWRGRGRGRAPGCRGRPSSTGRAGSGATSETWAAPPGSGASASVAGAYSEIAVGYLSVEARTGHLGGAIIGVGNSLLLSNDRSGVKIGLRDECGAGAEAGVNISIHGQLSFVIS